MAPVVISSATDIQGYNVSRVARSPTMAGDLLVMTFVAYWPMEDWQKKNGGTG